MPLFAWIIDADVPRLWGLESRERLSRQLSRIEDIELADQTQGSHHYPDLLILRGDHLFEQRALQAIAQRCGTLTANGTPVATRARAEQVPIAVSRMDERDEAKDWISDGTYTVDDLADFDPDLRRMVTPYVLPIRSSTRPALEARLYGNAYKGITDFVTKWWWPKPARRVVAWCAERRISANQVTVTGLLLMLFACGCFYYGHYAPGLVAGWIMTFLDTVDGKLARVTVSASRLGHVLDHGMDIVHPPFWYMAWGLSAGAAVPFADTGNWIVWMFAGYLAGRLIEGAFHALGSVSMFAWRPLDAYFRLFTARRNPCLVLLTLSWAAGRPDWGFVLVVVWTVLSSALMALRLTYAAAVRVTRGPLQSWLSEPDAAERYPRAFRTFSETRQAYVAN